MYTPEEIAAMTPAEQEMARSMNASEEAGKDLFGDGETAAAAAADETDEADETPPEGAEDTEGGATDAAAAEPAAAADDKPAEAAATTDEPAAEEPAAEPALQFKGEAPADAAAQITELRKQRLDARKKWSAGEIDEDQLDALESPIEDKIAELQRQQAVAEALQKANEQVQAQEQDRLVREAVRFVAKLRVDAKQQGIDYGTDKAPTEAAFEFDRQRQALALDPKWQNKSFAEQATRAHENVTKLYGPAPAAAAAPAVPGKTRPTPPAPPVTLRQLPAAEKANSTEGDLEAQWAAASGAAADRLWAKLSPAAQARLLGE